jgi:hypothetical protein
MSTTQQTDSVSTIEKADSPVDGDSSSEKSREGAQKQETARDEELDRTFAPINAPVVTNERSQKLQRQRTASSTISRNLSLNDGYSCHTADEEAGEKDNQPGEAADGDEYVVGWDENDPMNPRNMNTLRRWLIVIIVSSGSLCV